MAAGSGSRQRPADGAGDQRFRRVVLDREAGLHVVMVSGGLPPDPIVDDGERGIELAGVRSARLREIGTAATATTGDLGNLLNQLAGREALRQVLRDRG